MSIKLNAQSGGSVALDAPTQTTSSADLTFKLPVADGSANHVLKTDGSANLSFAEAVGKIRKYTTFTHDGYVTGNYEGDPNGIDHGYQLINASYTPAAADSTIVLLSSSLTIAEGSNQLNNFWLSAWEGSNFISAVSGCGRYTSFANYYNVTTLSYIGTFTSGSTNARNIMFRTGGDNTSNTSTVYINGNPNGYYSGNQNRFTVFLVELAP
jgi:hypothetical protein